MPNVPKNDTTKVTRLEVIDDYQGRVFTAKPCSVQLSYQDDGKTLKVFVQHVAKPKEGKLK